MAKYFTEKTDESIKNYLESTDTQEKHRIFNDEIRPAFQMLVQSLIYTYKFYGLDDIETLKDDCLTNLYEMLPKYDPSRCSKGFSYFNVVAKNWFIQKTRERARGARLESELYYDLDHEMVRRDQSLVVAPREHEAEEKEFWVSLYTEMDVWKKKLTKDSEKKVLEAVVFLVQNPNLVSIYNKKAVYFYLRELTGLNTKQVVVNLKKMKSFYLKWRDAYHTDGDAETT